MPVKDTLDDVQLEQILKEANVYDETPKRLKETWWVRETSGLFYPDKPPRLDLGDNVRNVLTCWWAPFELEIINHSNSFSPDLANFADNDSVDFLASLTIAVTFQTDRAMLSLNDYKTGSQVGDRKFYLFTKTKEMPTSLDDIFVLKLGQSVSGATPPYTIVGTLEQLSRTSTGSNSSFVVTDLWAKGYRPAPFDYVGDIKIQTGEDNYWPSYLKLQGEYQRNSALSKRQIPFKVANTIPLTYDIGSIRGNQADIAIVARRANFMMSIDHLATKFAGLGTTIKIRDLFPNQIIRSLAYMALFHYKLVKSKFAGVRQYKDQAEKDKEIETCLFQIRSIIGSASATDIASYVDDIISEARSLVDNSKNAYYTDTFDKDNIRGTFVEGDGGTSNPAPTDAEWDELYAFLSMASPYVFSGYSFRFGNNELNKLVLPLYLEVNNDLDIKRITDASNEETSIKLNQYSKSNESSLVARLSSKYLESGAATNFDLNETQQTLTSFTYENTRVSEQSSLINYEDFNFIFSPANLKSGGSSKFEDTILYSKQPSAPFPKGKRITTRTIDPGSIVSLALTDNPAFVFARVSSPRNSAGFKVFNSTLQIALPDNVKSAARDKATTFVRGTATIQYSVENYSDVRDTQADTYTANFIVYGILKMNLSFTTASGSFTISNEVNLQSDVNQLKISDQSIPLPFLPETLGENSVPTRPSGYADASINANIFWINAKLATSGLETLRPYIEGNTLAANDNFSLNTNTEFDLGLAARDPVNLPSLKSISTLTSGNIFASNVGITILLKTSNLPDRTISIGNLVDSRSAESIVLGNYNDDTIGLTTIKF